MKQQFYNLIEILLNPENNQLERNNAMINIVHHLTSIKIIQDEQNIGVNARNTFFKVVEGYVKNPNEDNRTTLLTHRQIMLDNIID